MGDPVGPDASTDDAAWKFREACDEAVVWPVFYQVNESSLGRYIEMGLSMIKLGETARTFAELLAQRQHISTLVSGGVVSLFRRKG